VCATISIRADTAKKTPCNYRYIQGEEGAGKCEVRRRHTVTHTDSDYMRRHYENFYNDTQAVTNLSRVDQTTRLEIAKKSFIPMYYIKMYPSDKSKQEMSFDCTNCQSQFPERVPLQPSPVPDHLP
jgi:hypothetical protein